MSRIRRLGSAIRRRIKGSTTALRERRFKAGVEGLEGRALLSKGLTEFPILSPNTNSDQSIYSMTKGPDGNIWFADGEVGKITPTGAVTLYPIPGSASRITSGPDGNLWFNTGIGTSNGIGIGKITPSGVVSLFRAPTLNELTAGPDGNVWFTGMTLNAKQEVTGEVVGKITPTGHVTTYPVPGSSVQVGAITRGRDENLWFLATTPNNTLLESVTTSGRITPHPIAQNSDGLSGPLVGYDITTGPDGNPWVLATGLKNGKTKNTILRINPSGTFTKFPVSLASHRYLGSIAAGPGRGLSFSVTDDNQDVGPNPQPTIGSITPNGRVTFTTLPRVEMIEGYGKNSPAPSALVTGADGNLWLADNSDYHVPSGVAIFRLNTRGGKLSDR